MHDYKDIGGLATITIKKSVGKSGVKISLENPTFTPTYVSNQKLQNYRVVPLKDAGAYGLIDATSKYDEIMTQMTQWLQ